MRFLKNRLRKKLPKLGSYHDHKQGELCVGTTVPLLENLDPIDFKFDFNAFHIRKEAFGAILFIIF